MKFDLTFSQLQDSKFGGILSERGYKDLEELCDHVREIGGDVDSLDDFVSDYFEDDGDAFVDSVIHAWSETIPLIDEYFGANESRNRRRTREARNRMRSRILNRRR
jgi:hypothetical protein